MEKGELVDRVIKLTQQLAAEQDKNKILAEQKAELAKTCECLIDRLELAYNVSPMPNRKEAFRDIEIAQQVIKQANK